MVTSINPNTYCFVGLSTDDKPTQNIGNGSKFIEMDTSKIYLFDAENVKWIETSLKA